MTSTQASVVDEQQIGFFRRNGYLHYGPLFDAGELAELREEIQRFIDNKYPACYRTDLWTRPGEEKQPVGKERLLQMVGLYRHSETIHKFAVQRKRGEIVAALVGCEGIQLLSDMTLYKPPGKGNSRPTKWHQDFPSNPNSLPDITSWMPLDDVDITNGCMQYVPGTHDLGELAPPGEEESENYERKGIDFSKVVVVPMKAGEVVFHHSNVLHYASENTSERPRRVYITRYMPSTTVYRWRPEIDHLYDGWNLKERQGSSFPRDEFPLVYP